MTVPTQLSDGWLIGVAADTKPTSYPAGTRMFETDTLRTYAYSGSVWVSLASRKNHVAKTSANSPYTILTSDDIINYDASGGASIATLPTAVGITGKEYTIRRTDILSATTALQVATTSSQTIGGAAAEYLWPGEYIKVESDGTNWQINARSTPAHIGYYFKKGTASPGNRRYLAGAGWINVATTTSTTLPAIDTLWTLPFPVGKTTKFDTISFVVGTVGGAGSVSRVGLYRDNGNVYPGALIFDSGSIDTSSGGAGAVAYDVTITSGLQVLPAGLYWLAWECGVAAPQIRILSGNSSCLCIMGHASAMTATTPAYAYSVAHSFGALPDPYTTGAGLLNAQPTASVPVPAIYLRPI